MKNVLISLSVFLSVLFVGTFVFSGPAVTKTEVVKVIKKDNIVSVNAEVNVGKELLKITPSKDRIVFLSGEVGANSLQVAQQIASLSAKSNDAIYLLIDSPGGSVMDGAMIISAIEASKAPVYTVCMQLCASMAAMIHQYGSERYAVDRSILMFHPASGGVGGTLEQMRSRLGYIYKYVTKMNAHVASRTGLELNKFQEMYMPELWLDAEDALSLRFVDKIVSVDVPEQALELITIPTEDKNKLLREKFNVIWK